MIYTGAEADLYMCRLELAECKETLAAERKAMSDLLQQPHVARAIALESACNRLLAELKIVTADRDHHVALLRQTGFSIGAIALIVFVAMVISFVVARI